MPNSIREILLPATSSPIVGTLTSTKSVSDMFKPQLGRNMYLTLQGDWDGNVQLMRSVDGGKTWNALTTNGGQPWLNFAGNCDEVVGNPSDAASLYQLVATLSRGSLTYRLAQ